MSTQSSKSLDYSDAEHPSQYNFELLYWGCHEIYLSNI